MDNLECKKCHKPLTHGNKCEACKQREFDKIKSHGAKAGAGIAMVAAFVISVMNKEDEE